ncbi:DUF993 family protein, partial [Streptomyces sp. NRRL F-7442]|uniref:DUF993 family protein n=1 Tax=Streptomyces sp. NRRL F-7442 TaxID=1519498 RepID=UPI00131B6D89
MLAPTAKPPRHLFQPPPRYYKSGVVFLAWLSGRQSPSPMAAALHAPRPLPHFARAYELADGLGLFPDPKLAQER